MARRRRAARALCVCRRRDRRVVCVDLRRDRRRRLPLRARRPARRNHWRVGPHAAPASGTAARGAAPLGLLDPRLRRPGGGPGVDAARGLGADRLGAAALASPLGDAAPLLLERGAFLRRAPPAALGAALPGRAHLAPPLGGDDAFLGVQLPPGGVVPARPGDAARASGHGLQPLGAARAHPHEPRAHRERPPAARARRARPPLHPRSRAFALPQPSPPRVPRALRLFAAASRPVDPHLMRAHPHHFDAVYLTSTGAFYPGEPVTNDEIDAYVAPLNGASPRIKRSVLAENGIERRYYSTGPDGATRFGAAEMAAAAIRSC